MIVDTTVLMTLDNDTGERFRGMENAGNRLQPSYPLAHMADPVIGPFADRDGTGA